MKTILTAKEISKSFGEKRILRDINVSLCEGELVSILGVSGVGKTTLFNILAGLILPDTGSVTLGGENIIGKTGRLSYMQQKDLLLEHKTVLDNTALPLILSGVKKKAAREMADAYFEQFGLLGTENKYPSQLSGGMRQRAAFLRTYLCKCPVALLDEPFSALDTHTKRSMEEWYLGVMDEIKLSTLFITHDVDEAVLISDRVYIMNGRPAGIKAELTIDEPKPRKGEFMLSDKFIEYKRAISAAI